MPVDTHRLSGRARLERCHGCEQGRNAEDVGHPLEIVTEDAQGGAAPRLLLTNVSRRDCRPVTMSRPERFVASLVILLMAQTSRNETGMRFGPPYLCHWF